MPKTIPKAHITSPQINNDQPSILSPKNLTDLRSGSISSASLAIAAGTPHNKATTEAKTALIGVNTPLLTLVSTMFSLKIQVIRRYVPRTIKPSSLAGNLANASVLLTYNKIG
jgi:hypothetical protein